MRKLDLSTYPRRDAYEFMGSLSYTLVFPIEVTRLRRFCKQEGISFYMGMCWCITEAMNSVEAFRCGMADGEPVVHDTRHPSFTYLPEGAEQFRIVTVLHEPDIVSFARHAREAAERQTVFIDMEKEKLPLIYLSCVPWMPITAVCGIHAPTPEETAPHVTWGRWEDSGGRLTLQLSVEVIHRFVDGLHMSRFYEALQRVIAGLDVREA